MRRAAFALALVAVGAEAQDSNTARRARAGDFDAKAQIACAQERGEALGVCQAGVARGDRGNATVAATFGSGFTRQLHFVDGAFVRASATMSGVGTDTDWRLSDGLHHLRVDDQRFEIPVSFLFPE